MAAPGNWQEIEGSEFESKAGSFPKFVKTGNTVHVFAEQTRPKVLNFDNAGERFMEAYSSGLDFPLTKVTAEGQEVNAMFTILVKATIDDITVTDNIPGSDNFSKVSASSGGMAVGANAYVSGVITFETIPEAYRGLTYLQSDPGRAGSREGTSGEQGYTSSLVYTCPATVSFEMYIAHDANIDPKPSWLYTGFTSTGEEITLSNGKVMQVWKRNWNLQAGTSTTLLLPGNLPSGGIVDDPAMSITFFVPIAPIFSNEDFPDDYSFERDLQNGKAIYHDRAWTYQNLPESGKGAYFLQTGFADRLEPTTTDPSTDTFLSFDLGVEAEVYILLDADAALDDVGTGWVDPDAVGPAWAEETGWGEVKFAGKPVTAYKATVSAGTTIYAGGNGGLEAGGGATFAENLNHNVTYRFFATYFRSWDGHEGPPSPISDAYTTENEEGAVTQIILTAPGVDTDVADQIRFYAASDVSERAFALIPEMVAENPGAGSDATVTFDYSDESLIAYGRVLNFLDRWKLPACRNAVEYSLAGRILMWGQDTFVPNPSDKFTARNSTFYQQAAGDLRLRIEMNPDNQESMDQTILWKSFVVGNTVYGDVIYVTQEESEYGYSGTVDVVYLDRAFQSQLYADGVELGLEDVGYRSFAGHKNRIWFTSIVAASDRDAVGEPVWQGMNPAIYLELEFGGYNVTGVHVEDRSVYIATDEPQIWKMNGEYLIGLFQYQIQPITFNRGSIAENSFHSLRNGRSRCLDQTGIIEVGPSFAENVTDQLYARRLFREKFEVSSEDSDTELSDFTKVRGIYDQKNEQSIFLNLRHDGSDRDWDRVAIDSRSSAVLRENTGHEITDLITIISDRGFQRLVFGDADGQIGEFKANNRKIDPPTHIEANMDADDWLAANATGFKCHLITGATDLGTPLVKNLNKVWIAAEKAGDGTAEMLIGVYGAYGDIDPDRIDFYAITEGVNNRFLPDSATYPNGANFFVDRVREADFGKWHPVNLTGTHFVLFVGGYSVTMPELSSKIVFDFEVHPI